MISNFHKLQVEIVSVTDIKPYASNARAHSHRQVQRIVESIK